MQYLVDFVLQIYRLLPPLLRREKMVSWLAALVKPLSQLHSSPSIVHPVRYPVCLTIPIPSFLSFRAHVNLSMSFNGQTIVLERLLNLHYFNGFDTYQTKGTQGYWIWIEDLTNDLEYKFVFLKYESQPVPLYLLSDYAPTLPPTAPPAEGTQTVAGPQYIFQVSDYYSQYDFVVWVPSWMVVNQPEMRTLIDRYKIAGTRYKIITY